MSPTRRILETLEERDLLELARRVAAEHHVTLEEICTEGHAAHVVDARHELWVRLRDQLPQAAVARLFGVDHSSIDHACRKGTRQIVSVVLDLFDAPGEGYLFRWQRRQGEPFGITQRSTQETTWYREYAVARARFRVLCERAGAPSFRSHANGHIGPPVEQLSDHGGAS